jgi:hypothetical protein
VLGHVDFSETEKQIMCKLQVLVKAYFTAHWNLDPMLFHFTAHYVQNKGKERQ